MTLHDLDVATQEVEELAEEMWRLREEDRLDLDALRGATQVAPLEPALARLVDGGLARVRGSQVELTTAGCQLAGRQVRRHRLAEVLLTTVIQAPDDASVNRTACVMEHVLDPATTDAVCGFLGHPRVCPHGKAIPPGECCHSLTRPDAPVIEPLSRLPPGSEASVVHMVPRDHQRLVRFASLGLAPGARLHVQQVQPTMVLRIGETTLAFERCLAEEIYVRRTRTA